MQTIQIVSGCVSLITAHNAYTSTNKTQTIQTETDLTFYQGWTCLMFTCMLQGYATSSLSTPTLYKFCAGLGCETHRGEFSTDAQR